MRRSKGGTVREFLTVEDVAASTIAERPRSARYAAFPQCHYWATVPI